MDAIKLTVRCMAWPEGEVWVAACIDLTLAAQILSYVREAVTIDAEHAEALLGRRAGHGRAASRCRRGGL